jgi:hypothetical protein
MTIASGLGMIVAGAILRYAVSWRSNWIDVDKVGQILMIGGSAGLAIGIVLQLVKRRSQVDS